MSNSLELLIAKELSRHGNFTGGNICKCGHMAFNGMNAHLAHCVAAKVKPLLADQQDQPEATAQPS
jgi:hypothetical protein